MKIIPNDTSVPSLSKRSHRPLVIGLICGICIGMLVGGLKIIAEYCAIFESVLEYNPSLVLQSHTLSVLLWILASLLLLVSILIMGIGGKGRPIIFAIILGCLSFMAVDYSSGYAVVKVQRLGFQVAINRAVPIIEAIKKYQLKYRKFPESLAQLVPEFLPIIPATGIPCCPEYIYSSDRQQGNIIRCDEGFMLLVRQNDDTVGNVCLYCPTKNWGVVDRHCSVERLGDWSIVDYRSIVDWR